MSLEKELPYYDKNGLEIEEGDLLKVYHFQHYLRRRKVYMYHIALLQESNGKLWWAGKDYNRMENKGHYWLKSVANKDTRIIAGTEVIKKPNYEDEDKLRKEARIRIKQLNNSHEEIPS